MAKYQIKGPDGSSYEVNAPDDASQDDVLAYAKTQFAQPQQAAPTQPAPQQPQAPQNTAGIDSSAMGTRGMTLGASDYVGAAGRYAGDLAGRGLRILGADVSPLADESYNDALKGIRQSNEAYRKSDPIKAYGSEIAGGIVSPVFGGIQNKVSAATANAPRYLGYATQGGAAGGAVGLGNAQGADGGVPSVGDVAKSVGVGAAGGAAMGVTVPAVTELGAKIFKGTFGSFGDKIGSIGKTAEDFKNASQAAYKASEDAGVVISPEAMQKFSNNLPSDLVGYHPVVNKKAGAIIKMLQDESGQPMTLSYLEGLRSVASEESVSSDLNHARLSSSIVGKIDKFVSDLQPEDLFHLGGDDVGAAKDALDTARGLWRTTAKLKDVERIVSTGENLGDPNYIKNQFRAIVRSPQKFDLYNDEEKKAIVDIAKTGALEKISKLIPWRGLQMASTYAGPMQQQAKVGALYDSIAGSGPPIPGMTPRAQPAIYGASSKALPLAARIGVPVASPFYDGRIKPMTIPGFMSQLPND